jgi:RHS repeat-associated protein
LNNTTTDRRVFHIGGLNLGAPHQRRAVGPPRTDSNGHERRLGFEDGRLTSIREPDGSRTRYRYDADQLVCRTDALGLSSRYTYDDAGRLESVTFPDGATLRLTYDDRGRLTRRILPNHHTAHLEYDGDVLRRVTFSPDDTVTMTYDVGGRLQNVTESGCVTDYSYDAQGRLEGMTRHIDGVPFNLRCNAEGRPITLQLPTGETVDLGGQRQGPGGQSVGGNVRFDRAANVVASDEGEFVYDACEQLVEARHPRYGGIYYEYDAVGNRTIRRAADGETRYSYDGCHRLVRVLRQDGSSIHLEYDAQGNLTCKRDGDTTWRYAYNGRQQLASIRRNGRVVARYRYDLWGRRIWRRVGEETTLYHYDPDGRLVAMTRPDGRLVAAFRYERGLIVMYSTERTYALHTDHLGSTQRITDEKGNVVWRADYSPFGRLRNAPPDFECPLFTGRMWDVESGLYYFGARYYDPEVGRFTTPDPWTGGPDDVRLVGGMGIQPVLPQSWLSRPRLANRYLYCLNNPATYRDPEGFGVLGTIGKTILAIIWSSPWTLLGATLTLLDWLFQFPLLGFLYLPSYGIDGVASGRLGSAAMINIGGLGPSPLVMANILFARRGFVDELDDTAQEYIIPVEADREPRQLRTARTAYFEHLLSHTVHANFSGPFWPFVYLFASDTLEKDAVRDSGFTRIADPTLTLAPDKIYTSAGNDLIVIGGQKPYTTSISNAAAGEIANFTDRARFSEAHLTPQYWPGEHTVTVKDNVGISDSRDMEIASLRIKDVAVVRPNTVFVDKLSDHAVPTLRLVEAGGPARATATVKVDVEPDQGEIFFDVSNPPNPAPLVLSRTGGIGDTEVTVTPQNAPRPVGILFDADTAFQADLENGNLPAGLQQVFQNNGIQVPPPAPPVNVGQAGRRWSVIIAGTVFDIRWPDIFVFDSNGYSVAYLSPTVHADLESNNVSADLRQEFQNHGIVLTANPVIATLRAGTQWRITDGARVFTARGHNRLSVSTTAGAEPQNHTVHVRPWNGGSLFTIPFSVGIQNALDARTISVELRERFQLNGVTLSSNATVVVLQAGVGWDVTDRDQIFTIRRDGANLNVFPALKRVQVRSLATINVVLQAHIVRRRDRTGAAADQNRLDNFIRRANEVWQQAGVQFTWRADTQFIDEDNFLTIFHRHPNSPDEEPDMFRWRPPAPQGPGSWPDGAGQDHNTLDTPAIHVYFVNDFDPLTRTENGNVIQALAFASGNHVVMSKSASGDSLAHEIGHCLGLPHPDQTPPAPAEADKRVMFSQSGATPGDRFLIANQEPGRVPPSGDETAHSRSVAARRIGP